MLFYLFRWIFGYVKFTFEGGFTEAFLNEVYQNKINVHNIKIKNNVLTATIMAKEYKRLHRIAFHHGGVVKITKKFGLAFITLPLKSRFGIFFGGIIFMILLSFLSGSIWNIEITGNSRVSDEKLMVFLEQNDVTLGSRIDSKDYGNIECDIMANFSDVSWAKINRIGTTVRLEINEATKEPETVDEGMITNVKSKKDGVIISVNSQKGWDAVKKGDAVTKGDLLISGIKESEVDKKNHYVHARGKVLAQVQDEVKICVSREQSNKTCKNTEEKNYLYFFGITVPLFIDYKNDDTNKSISYKYDYIKINKKAIPIGIKRKIIKTYENNSFVLDDKSLQELAKVKIEEKIISDYENSQIISQKISYNFTSEFCVVSAKIKAIEEIGEEIEIKVNN